MLTIRPGTTPSLSRVEAQKFEEWMLAHLKKFFLSGVPS